MIKYPGNSAAGAACIAGLPQASTQGTATIVKGWNEPDHQGQAGSIEDLRRNPEAYAQQWTQDMTVAKAKGYTEFIAPAIAHDTIWLDFFLKGCEATAGCRDTITYLSCHRYRPDCAGYRADPQSMGWRDDLSYLLTMYRLMRKYNERGFHIRGLVMDELGCVTPDWSGFAPEVEEVRYLNQFYRDTIVAVKIGDQEAINKVKRAPWIMPKGPDAHEAFMNYAMAIAQERALDGGPQAGAEAVQAIQNLVSVAWFSQAPGRNFLSAHGSADGVSAVGKAYLDSCKLLQLESPAALTALKEARQQDAKMEAALAPPPPPPPEAALGDPAQASAEGPPAPPQIHGGTAGLPPPPPPPSTDGTAPIRGGSDFPRFCGVATHVDNSNFFNTRDLMELAGAVGPENLWHYNWSPTSQVQAAGVEYVPTIKFPGDSDLGASDIAKLPKANTEGAGVVVKGWNEPDDQGEAGRIDTLRTNPESYAKQWTTDMNAAKAKGYTEFIGPAIAHDTIWLDFFLKGCEATDGCKDTMTYLAFHRYRPDCADYKADADNMGWRDDLSYLLTMERLKEKYNKRGFQIRGLVMDELGCFRSDWSGFAPESDQVRYVNEFYRDTLVAVKVGDTDVIDKVKKTPWVMPKGPDAHDAGLNYTSALAQQKALDGGATAGEDTVRAIEDLVSVAWFSMVPGANYLPAVGPAAGLSDLGRSYLDACKLVQMPQVQAMHDLVLARQGALPPPPPPPREALARKLGVVAAENQVSVRVVSRVCPSAACPYETKAVSLFIGMTQVALGCQAGVDDSHSFTYDTRSINFALGFGVQDNGWYWRGYKAQASEQNPDNAGMQVFLNVADCSVRTSASIAGGDVPDARRLLSVMGTRGAHGGCEVVVERLSKPTLCVAGVGAKQCCPPCSLPMFEGLATCCSKEADGGRTTCEHEATPPRLLSV